ncbi:MAG: hypothetical protein NTW14_14045 [bacterium]|nr:hypothetical protein [bacterium]
MQRISHTLYRLTPIFWMAPFCLCLSLSACHKKSPDQSKPLKQTTGAWDESRAETEYKILQAELQLAKAESLYFVIDLPDKLFQLKLKGAVLWDYPIHYIGNGSSDADKFFQRFQAGGQYLVRPITGRYLFAGREKTADSLLAIIAKVVNVEPELLQREIPERFQLQWGDGLMLDVSTDVSGTAKFPFKNTLVGVGQALARPFGEARISVKMDTSRAITFYRVTEIGLPTIVYPPHRLELPPEKSKAAK